MKTVSLNELIYELLELRRSYLKETDPIPKRLVVDWIQSQRARLIDQKYKKTMPSFDDHLIQDLGNAIPMEKYLSNTVNPQVNNYDYLYRTSIEIPRVIESFDGVGLFSRIGPADRLSDPFQLTTYNKALMLGYGKFNYNAIYAFVLGDRICLHSNSGIHFTIKYIDVRGIFQDPIAAALIKDPNWTYDDDYPINKEMVDQLKVLIIKEKFGLTLAQPDDKKDNKDDDPEGSHELQKRATEDIS